MLFFGGGDTSDYDALLKDIQQRMNIPGFEQALGGFLGDYQGMVGGIGLPQLSPEIMQQIHDVYQRSMQTGQDVLGQAADVGYGAVNARAATRGLLSSSAHGSMAADVNKQYQQELMKMQSEAANREAETVFGLRSQMLGEQTGRLGIYGSALPGLYGGQMQGYGAQLGALGGRQEAQQGMWERLMGIGAGIPGMLDWIKGLGKKEA